MSGVAVVGPGLRLADVELVRLLAEGPVLAAIALRVV